SGKNIRRFEKTVLPDPAKAGWRCVNLSGSCFRLNDPDHANTRLKVLDELALDFFLGVRFAKYFDGQIRNHGGDRLVRQSSVRKTGPRNETHIWKPNQAQTEAKRAVRPNDQAQVPRIEI